MSKTQNTLLLDTSVWDLVLDSSGNIALASPPYAVAQDVASAMKLFQGELWYDTTQGVPFWQDFLGQNPTSSQIIAAFNAAALTVPGVKTASTVLVSLTNRNLTGQVQFSTSDGTSSTVNF